MRTLIDTNVVLDVFLKRQPHYAASNKILKLARRQQIRGAVAAHSLANLFYLSGKACLPFIRDHLLEDCETVCGNSHQTKTSLNLGLADLEDALQVSAALEWKAAFIVTRNVRDFKRSPVPALSPAEWIKRFGPDLKS